MSTYVLKMSTLSKDVRKMSTYVLNMSTLKKSEIFPEKLFSKLISLKYFFVSFLKL